MNNHKECYYIKEGGKLQARIYNLCGTTGRITCVLTYYNTKYNFKLTCGQQNEIIGIRKKWKDYSRSDTVYGLHV